MIEIYEEKENLNTNPSVAETNKVTAENMNQLREAVIQGIYNDVSNNCLKDKTGTQINPVIPRYEKLADVTLEGDSSEITIPLDLDPGVAFKLLIDGSTGPSDSSLTNVGCYPNNNNAFSVARVAGFENNAGNINSVYNVATSNMYLARVIKGNNFIVDVDFSWNGSFLKNISSYATPGINNVFIFGNLSSIVTLSDNKLTSLRITITSGQFVAGTRVKIYGKV